MSRFAWRIVSISAMKCISETGRKDLSVRTGKRVPCIAVPDLSSSDSKGG